MRDKKALFLTLILLATVLQLPLAISDPGWLAGWGYRVQITIDADDVDTELTHFPVLIKISDSSGINGTDITFIFDEVETNSLKIAVTKADGLTELYVEVEDWNNVTEEAFLWVSKPDWTLSNLTDTVIYLYYDNDHADNTYQVGPVGSLPGEFVWDSNFKMVLHLSEDAGDFIDSTSNDNDAGEIGDGVSREDELIDGTVNLAGTNDYLRQETAGLGSGWDDITVEIIASYDVFGANRYITSAWGGVGGEDCLNLAYYNAQTQVRFSTMSSDNTADHVWFGADPVAIDTWYHYAGVRKRDDFIYGYENGVETRGDATPDLPLDTYTYKEFFGQYPGGGGSMDGDLDEIRMSDSRRSADWVEVTYETGRDHLAYFGSEEKKSLLESPAFLFGAGFNASSPWVSLYWKTNLTDITLFEVQNSTDKTSWDYLGSNTTAEYHDFEVVNGTQRYYRVRACNLTDAVWDNSTWTDINYERVYFVMPEGDEVCEGHIFNASSIAVIAGTLDDGNLASTFVVDGDWYSVSEVVGPPGLDIRVNFTYIGESVTCGCIEIYHVYLGHSPHEVQVQVWNFTDSSWGKIGKILFNETEGWACVGLGHNPEHYISGGEAWFRFYHPERGHIAHTLHIDRIDLRVVYAEECPACPPAPSLAMGKYYAMAIILLILGILLGLGMRKR